MQLLPKTGKTVAKQVKLKGYSAPQLYTPAVNLQLGTRYFKDMVDKYNGQFEYALAAYNAGTDRVGDWLGQGHYRDPQEFVESIPFTETREYVQAILRNRERLPPALRDAVGQLLASSCWLLASSGC